MNKQFETSPSTLGWTFLLFLGTFLLYLFVYFFIDYYLRSFNFDKKHRIFYMRFTPYKVISDVFLGISFLITVPIGIGGFYDDFVNIVLKKVFSISQPDHALVFYINLVCFCGILSPLILNIKTLSKFLGLLRDRISSSHA